MTVKRLIYLFHTCTLCETRTHTLLSPLTQSLISSDTCKGQSCPLAFGHDTPVATSKPSGEGRVGDGGWGRLTAQNGGIKPIAAFCLPLECITIE